jgi:hypothetical protein
VCASGVQAGGRLQVQVQGGTRPTLGGAGLFLRLCAGLSISRVSMSMTSGELVGVQADYRVHLLCGACVHRQDG